MIELVNVYKGKCNPPFHDGIDGDVYIGRYVPWTDYHNTKWGNPFSEKEFGREKAIALYREWLDNELAAGRLNLDELRGAKRLGCWCKPAACHGDILKEYLERDR